MPSLPKTIHIKLTPSDGVKLLQDALTSLAEAMAALDEIARSVPRGADGQTAYAAAEKIRQRFRGGIPEAFVEAGEEYQSTPEASLTRGE